MDPSKRGKHPEATIRVEITQPALPKYRVPVFRMLAARRDLKVDLSYFPHPGVPCVAPDGFAAAAMPYVSFQVLGRRLNWYPRQWQMAGGSGPDVAVHEWNLNNLSLVPSLVRSRINGQGTVVWGHGRPKADSRLRLALRRAVGRLADSTVFYDQWTLDDFVNDGFPESQSFVAPNSLDTSEIDQQIAQRRRQRDAGLIVHVSRLRKSRDLDTLFLAVATLAQGGADARIAL